MAWTPIAPSAPSHCHGDSAGLGNGNEHHSQKSEARLRKSKSYGDVLRPLGSLARVVRDPSALVKSAGGLIWAGDVDDTASLQKLRSADLAEEARKRALYVHMEAATSYAEWFKVASEIDELEGNNTWKRNAVCEDYNAELVQSRLRDLDSARLSGDPQRMLRLIRTALTRGLGGMGDQRLYGHSHTGTKELIERYIDSATSTISTFVDVVTQQDGRPGALDPKMVREELLRARQSFGRSAVLLSGGGTFGLNHIGVVKALHERQLLPRILSGASAGSIVAAVLCTKTDEEIPDVIEALTSVDLDIFEREGVEDGLYQKAMRFLTHGSLFDISNLVRVMQGIIGNLTFLEAYNRTRRVLNIGVSSSSAFDTPRLLNYITAPDVMIWSAVAASCSVPFFFSPATLQTKDRRTGEQRDWNPTPQLLIDGSVDNDLPMARLAELFNVNHFVVSQVNPHVVPFMNKDDLPAPSQSFFQRAAVIAKEEALHRMHVIAELGIMPSLMTKTRSILGQRYSGDITIFPPVNYALVLKALQNPTREFVMEAVAIGEKATWPKLARISNHVAIELALDSAVHEMINRAAFSPDQVALRRRRLANMTASNARPKSTVLIRSNGSETTLHRPGSAGGDEEEQRRRHETIRRLGGNNRVKRRRPLSAQGPATRHARYHDRVETTVAAPPSPAASFVSTFSLTPSFVPQAPGSTTTLPTMPTYGTRFVQPDHSRPGAPYRADFAGTAPLHPSDYDDDADDDSANDFLTDQSSTMEPDGPMSSPPTHDSGDEFPGLFANSAAHKKGNKLRKSHNNGNGSSDDGSSRRWKLFASSSNPTTPSGSFGLGSAFTMSSAAVTSDGDGSHVAGANPKSSSNNNNRKPRRKTPRKDREQQTSAQTIDIPDNATSPTGWSRDEFEDKPRFLGTTPPPLPSFSSGVAGLSIGSDGEQQSLQPGDKSDGGGNGRSKGSSFLRRMSPKGSSTGLSNLALGLTAGRGKRRARE